MAQPAGGAQPVPRTETTSEGRHLFQHEGRTIYEWEQSLEEVNIYIRPPEGVTARMLAITITLTHLCVGIKGNPPFIDHDTAGPVIVEDSMWTMDDGEVNINLQKVRKGETWPAALAGHGQMDPVTQEEDQKRIMLERFQEENPGFDFSGADFSGAVPDPRAFMGGVSYKK